MLEPIFAYVKAVLKYWWWLIVGGFGGATGILPLLGINWNIPQWIGILVLFIGLSIAQYLTYANLNKEKAKFGVALQNKYESKDIYNQIKQDIIRDIQSGKIKVKGMIKGGIEYVSKKDKMFLLVYGKQMRFMYGHNHCDALGLLADRASGIDLNELMERDCTICGRPRNQRQANTIGVKQ